MEENNLSRGILITKDLMDRKSSNGKEILFIPAWLALLARTGITQRLILLLCPDRTPFLTPGRTPVNPKKYTRPVQESERI